MAVIEKTLRSDFGFESPGFTVDGEGNVIVKSITLSSGGGGGSATDFTITEVGGAFRISGLTGDNPALTLNKGQAYSFTLSLVTLKWNIRNASRTANYNTGISHSDGSTGATAQNKSSGVFTFNISSTAPNTLSFCDSDGVPFGVITLQEAGGGDGGSTGGVVSQGKYGPANSAPSGVVPPNFSYANSPSTTVLAIGDGNTSVDVVDLENRWLAVQLDSTQTISGIRLYISASPVGLNWKYSSNGTTWSNGGDIASYTGPATISVNSGAGFSMRYIAFAFNASSSVREVEVDIGASTGGSIPGNFTTLSASSTVTLNPASANVTISPTGSGTITIAPANTGNINNTNIGVTTPGSGRFTSLISTTNINLTATSTGSINNVAIGTTTPSTGNFTSVTINTIPTLATNATNKKYVDSFAIAMAVALS
jgi:hypothetical protein